MNVEQCYLNIVLKYYHMRTERICLNHSLKLKFQENIFLFFIYCQLAACYKYYSTKLCLWKGNVFAVKIWVFERTYLSKYITVITEILDRPVFFHVTARVLGMK